MPIFQRISAGARTLFRAGSAAATDQPQPSGALPQYPPLIFLDSNNVHWARLYIDFAADKNLPPFDGAEMHSADEALKRNFTGRTLRDYIKGRKIVTHLRKRCTEDSAQVEYSPITALEITCGLLRGNAIREAAGEGVTHRMWGKIDETEVLERLEPTVYTEIQKHTSDVESQFDKAGIALRAMRGDRLREAWSLSLTFLAHVYLEVGDALVVASAVLAESDELLSGDKYVRDVVNRIENADGLLEPDRSHYKVVQTKIRNAIAAVVGVPPEEIRLPKAPERF